MSKSKLDVRRVKRSLLSSRKSTTLSKPDSVMAPKMAPRIHSAGFVSMTRAYSAAFYLNCALFKSSEPSMWFSTLRLK